MTPTIKWAIALLMGATIFRVQAGLFLSDLQMFGGPAPDGWFGPGSATRSSAFFCR